MKNTKNTQRSVIAAFVLCAFFGSRLIATPEGDLQEKVTKLETEETSTTSKASKKFKVLCALAIIATVLDWYFDMGYITPHMSIALNKALGYLQVAGKYLPAMPACVQPYYLAVMGKLALLRSTGSQWAGVITSTVKDVWNSLPPRTEVLRLLGPSMAVSNLITKVVNGCKPIRSTMGSVSGAVSSGAHWFSSQAFNLKDAAVNAMSPVFNMFGYAGSASNAVCPAGTMVPVSQMVCPVA